MRVKKTLFNHLLDESLSAAKWLSLFTLIGFTLFIVPLYMLIFQHGKITFHDTIQIVSPFVPTAAVFSLPLMAKYFECALCGKCHTANHIQLCCLFNSKCPLSAFSHHVMV